MTDNSSPKKNILDSFLKPRRKGKQPQFGLYLDQEMNNAVQLAEKISQLSDSSESQTNLQTNINGSADILNLQEISEHINNTSEILTDTLSESPEDSKSVLVESKKVAKKVKKQVGKQVKKQDHGQVNRQIENPSDYWLTPNQYIILNYLYRLKSRVACVPEIVQHTNIPYGTVRGCIRTLIELNCISKPKYLRKGAFRGFSYTINELRCEELLQRHLGKQLNRHVNGHVERQVNEHVGEQENFHLNGMTVQFNANLLPKNAVQDSHNNKTFANAIAEALATHPELGYWRQKKLTPQQVQKWMEITGASLESMIQSLCHCRFEMVEMNLEQEKNIQNVFNWFYRIIERAGFYPKPKGYQSYLERQLEIEKKLLAEKQERLKALAELQQQKKETERSLAFYEMLSQPDSELYQQCFSRLDKFTQNTKNTSLFERFMRDAFDQIMDEREQQILDEAKHRQAERQVDS